MAKIWKGHRGESTKGYYFESLEEDVAAELRQPKSYAAKLGKHGDPCTWEKSELEELKPSAAELGQLKTPTAEIVQLKTSAAENGQLKPSAAELGELKTSAAEFGQLKASGAEFGELKASGTEFGELNASGTSLSSSFDSVTLLQPQRCKSQIKEEEEDSDQPLDLSSSKSK